MAIKDPRRRRRRASAGARDFEALARRIIDEERMPGIAAAVLRGGAVTWAKGFGLADLDDERDVARDTVFQLASVSKLVTGVAALRCFERNRVDLDGSASSLLGWRVAHPRHGRVEITPRMLLTHTSSIQDNWDVIDEYYVFDEDTDVALGDFLRGYLDPDGDDYDAGENFLRGAPGTENEYSNMAVALLGHLVERVDGRPFDRFCDEELFAPAGMRSTTWRISRVDEDRAAWPYSGDDEWETKGFFSTPDYPDGQLCSTVEDMCRFMHVAMGWDDRLRWLSPEMTREMLRVQRPDLDEDQGLIWYWNDVGGRRLAGHSGGEDGITTTLWVDPEERAAFAVFMNGEEDEDDDESAEDDLLAALVDVR